MARIGIAQANQAPSKNTHPMRWLVALSVGVLVGCSTGTPKAAFAGSAPPSPAAAHGSPHSSATSPSDPTGYAALYQAGRYAEAYQAAARAAGSPRTSDARAALTAGLAARALDRHAEAERWLSPLTSSGDAYVAGHASAALGLIAKERGENAKATELLVAAATRLRGDDSARALLYAGDAMRSEGRGDEARNLYAQARDRVDADATLRMHIGDRLAGYTPPAGASVTRPGASGGWYTVQAGAFAGRPQADRLASKLGAGSRIVMISAKGRPMFAVRYGQYQTKPEADVVRKKIGSGAFVTSMASE